MFSMQSSIRYSNETNPFCGERTPDQFSRDTKCFLHHDSSSFLKTSNVVLCWRSKITPISSYTIWSVIWKPEFVRKNYPAPVWCAFAQYIQSPRSTGLRVGLSNFEAAGMWLHTRCGSYAKGCWSRCTVMYGAYLSSKSRAVYRTVRAARVIWRKTRGSTLRRAPLHHFPPCTVPLRYRVSTASFTRLTIFAILGALLTSTSSASTTLRSCSVDTTSWTISLL